MIELRPYQHAIIEEARAHLRAGTRRILIHAPTGSGKTVLTAAMLGKAAAAGRRSVFNVHRRELIQQSSRTFNAVGIKHAIVAAGFAGDRRQTIQLASIQTLARRLDMLHPPELVVWDECHHIAAKSWASVFRHWPNAVHIGLTATPQRLDGRGLDEYFDVMVQGPDTRTLIADGFLAPYKLYAPPGVDLTGLHTRMGDYVQSELAAAVDRPTITGDAVSHYRRHLGGKRAVAFCVSVKHSQHVAETFRAAGIPAAHVDGDTDVALRDQCIKAFERGDLLVLCNVDLFGEGFDLPSMEGVILLRPTQSLGLYLQQVGRSLRTSPGKARAVILDHAGNSSRHGLPDEDREWSLAGRDIGRRKEGERQVPIKTCPTCFAVVHPAVTVCACGHRFVPEGRKVAEQEGDLVEVDPMVARRAKKAEQAKSESLDDLVALGTRRGYKRPHLWARHIWNARQARLRGSG